MIANFLSAWSDILIYVKNQHKFIVIISFVGTHLMLVLYSSFKERYKYIGEYSPNNNQLFEISVISILITGIFFYIVFDEKIIKALFAMIFFIMFIMIMLFVFDLLIDKDKDNATLYKIIFYLLFLFFISTLIVASMIFISINNIDCSDCVKWVN